MTSVDGRFLTRDRDFYKTLLRLMSMVILQNVIAYSVNMADNLMLGSYSQAALSGAAAVNQIQFMVQQITMAIGDSVVVLGSQYWGQKNTAPIRRLCGIALLIGFALGGLVLVWTSLDPRGILLLFTDEEAYIEAGVEYLHLIRFTYPLYITSAILMAALRTVETVSIALWVSVSSLVLDVIINYTLIFGHFGAPELGITGASVGTLAARITELLFVLLFLLFRDKKLCLFSENPFSFDGGLLKDYNRIFFPSVTSNVIWSITTPIQTSILGHLSPDAIAANSVSVTMFQYLKIVTIGEASASNVIIGTTVGANPDDDGKVKEYSRTLQVLFVLFGLFLGGILYAVRVPYLKLYDLTPGALSMADEILKLLCVIFVCMAYQMPTMVGIIKGGGDVKYVLILNLIGAWGFVMPLSLLAAYIWKLPILWIVAFLNCDQILKCVPVFIHANRYRWIRHLTGKNHEK